MIPISIAYDPLCLAHQPGIDHPESPLRLQALAQLIHSAPVQSLHPQFLTTRDATRAELARVHTASHLDFLDAVRGQFAPLDADTAVSPQSIDAAVRAAGSVLAATESVIRTATPRSFALVRPPGHHAEPDRPMGFCLLNNAAVAARHAREVLGLRRVAVVDFDVHHGNGTQAAFWTDPSVLYISTHQAPLYPGSGAVTEMGAGQGLGRNINIPLGAGHGDVEYDAIYGAMIARILEQFRPELIIVSAGYDIAASDPLGGMDVTADGFARIAAHLCNAADLVCGGRLVFVLEGGYHVSALSDGVLATLEAMAGRLQVDDPKGAITAMPLGDAKQWLEAWEPHFAF